MRMPDGSTMTLPPPSYVVNALEHLDVRPGKAFLDVGCGTGYVAALAACLLGAQAQGAIYGVECVGSRLEQARSNVKALRDRLALVAAGNAAAQPPTASGGSSSAAVGAAPLSPSWSGLAVAGTVLGDPHKALNCIDLSLGNVLVPECTEGVVFDCLYCDASLSEEDLPMFLSLLKPGGKMVVVLDDDSVLVTRGGEDAHDFTREVIGHIGGSDFGELEDPTPWEVQEAIRRIKERERRKGAEQAKTEVTNLRSYEYIEMEQRVRAAMQRISELESIVQRDPSMRSPLRSSLGPGGSAGAPSASAAAGFGGVGAIQTSQLGGGDQRSPMQRMDDVRSGAKDKDLRRVALRVAQSPRPSPTPLSRMGSVPDNMGWKEMYSVVDSAARGGRLLKDFQQAASGAASAPSLVPEEEAEDVGVEPSTPGSIAFGTG